MFLILIGKVIMESLEKVFEYNQFFVMMLEIINRAKRFPPNKGHKHHIIPKCWYKFYGKSLDNSKSNLVLLSKDDHVKVHILASKCIKGENFRYKMRSSANIISHQPIFLALGGTNHPTFGRHQTEEARKRISSCMKEYRKDHPVPKETFEKAAKSRTGKKRGKYKLTYTTWVVGPDGKRIYR